MELPPIVTIRDIVQAQQAALGLKRVDGLAATLLGQGEANLNVLLTLDDGRQLNLRIGMRGAASAETLRREFAILRLAPAGSAPQAYAADFSERLLPAPYLLLEYLPGSSKTDWTTADLARHARSLARLHTRTFPYHGDAEQPTAPPFDMLQRFDVALDYWRRATPELLELAVSRRLLAPIRHFIAERQPLFAALNQFAVVHGDAHPLNVLFDGDQVRYIDWEWAALGDPAMDVAAIGWDISTAWQFELTGNRLERFLAAYQEQRADATLAERREVWMLFTMFFDQLYHRTQIAGDTTGRQAYTVERIEGYLLGRFG